MGDAEIKGPADVVLVAEPSPPPDVQPRWN
jgi:hypothetical protein